MTLSSIEQLAAIEAELIRQTGCRAEEIAGVYQSPISQSVVNARMGEALRARFAAEGERDALRAQNAALTKELEKVREVLHEQTTYLADQIGFLTNENTALLAALEGSLGIVQASIVNAGTRNEYPAIIANMEMKEAAMRAAIAAAKGER